MSSEAEPTAAGQAGPWPVLDTLERRVLGVLVEKAKTTPDAYPLSLNALVTGCNQKSNRDPVLQLTEDQVEEALGRCQRKGLVIKITGSGRVVRWRHNLYEAWLVDKEDLALLAELLLRGPQTEGELRTRASRMEPLDDLDALRAALRPLVERKLVHYLTPEGRGAVVTHGFHEPDELARLRAVNAGQPAAALPAANVVSQPPAPARETVNQAVEVQAEVGELKRAVVELRAAVAALQQEVRGLKQALGV
jgi:uncharacterized protein YceH (UPF0502 family)